MAKMPLDKDFLEDNFGDMNFPVHRNELITRSRNEQLDEDFTQLLSDLPAKEYKNLDDVYVDLTDAGGSARPNM